MTSGLRSQQIRGGWSAALLALALGAYASDRADAQDPSGFRSPSGNIHCQYFKAAAGDPPGSSTLRCDLAATSNPQPRRPRDCPLEYGHAFEMLERGGSPGRICHGDTAIDASLPVLAYGSVWTRGGFTCRSEPSGVTCTNSEGRGFALARAVQRLF